VEKRRDIQDPVLPTPAAAGASASGEVTDESLMVRFQGGDATAFRQLLGRWSERLYAFCYRHVREEDASRDVVQDCFVRVVRNAGTFRAEARFSTWLFTIARNLCLDRARRMKFRRTTSLDAPLGDDPEGATLMERVADDKPLADVRTDDRRFSARLDAALATLPEEQREVFLMRELDGLKFREVADVLGIPENTVKSRMRYALEGLRRQLGDLADLGGAG
jgi:RNA polymerase sigma-70 factor (ECF subfamily)